MSERIEAGDLVEVIYWPCGCRLGARFVVTHLSAWALEKQSYLCGKCLHELDYYGGIFAGDDSIRAHAPVEWLKKLPPLAADESAKTKQEIAA